MRCCAVCYTVPCYTYAIISRTPTPSRRERERAPPSQGIPQRGGFTPVHRFAWKNQKSPVACAGLLNQFRIECVARTGGVLGSENIKRHGGDADGDGSATLRREDGWRDRERDR